VKALPFEIINYTKLDFGTPDMQEDYVAPMEIRKPQSVVIESIDSKFSSQAEPNHSEVRPTNLKVTAQEAEYDAILKTLKDVRYNKSRAADKLGIDRKTLYNKLKKYGIE
jgi:two-component system, NtrC family, response regulator HydG